MSSHSSSNFSKLHICYWILSIGDDDGEIERTFSYVSYFEKMPLKKFETESKNPGPYDFFLDAFAVDLKSYDNSYIFIDLCIGMAHLRVYLSGIIIEHSFIAILGAADLYAGEEEGAAMAYDI